MYEDDLISRQAHARHVNPSHFAQNLADSEILQPGWINTHRNRDMAN